MNGQLEPRTPGTSRTNKNTEPPQFRRWRASTSPRLSSRLGRSRVACRKSRDRDQQIHYRVLQLWTILGDDRAGRRGYCRSCVGLGWLGRRLSTLGAAVRGARCTGPSRRAPCEGRRIRVGMRFGYVDLPQVSAGCETLVGDPCAQATPRLAELAVATSVEEACGTAGNELDALDPQSPVRERGNRLRGRRFPRAARRSGRMPVPSVPRLVPRARWPARRTSGRRSRRSRPWAQHHGSPQSWSRSGRPDRVRSCSCLPCHH